MICNCAAPATTSDAPTTEEAPEVNVETIDLYTTMPWESIATLEATADHVFAVPFGDGIEAYDWGVRDKKLYAVFNVDCAATPGTKKTIEDGMRRHFGDGKIVFSCGSLIATMSPHSAAGPEFSSEGDSLTANDKVAIIGGSVIGACFLIIAAVLWVTRGQGGYSIVG